MKITKKDIGRKVIANGKIADKSFENEIGTLQQVTDTEPKLSIKFVNNINGHSLFGMCDHGNEWYVNEENITFISPPNEFLEYFKNNRVVVNCETKQEAKWFCEWMHNNGMRWISGCSYKDHINWDNSKENTCYCGNNTYQEIQYFKERKYEIIKWRDLMSWEEDMKIALDDEFLKRFKGEKIAVRCNTKQEADHFCKFIDYYFDSDEWEYRGEHYWMKDNDCFFWSKEEDCRDGHILKSLEQDGYEIIDYKDLNFEIWKQGEDNMKETFEVGDEVELVRNYYSDDNRGNNTGYKCGYRFIIRRIESSIDLEAGQGWLCDESGLGVFASICKIVNKAKDIDIEKEENKMDYKVVKTFTLKDILEKDPCSEEFDNLVDELIEQDGYNFRAICKGNIHFNENNWKEYETFQNNLDWLEENGFIEKVKTFEPFDLKFRIENREELETLWCRMNVPVSDARSGEDGRYKVHSESAIKQWEIVDKEMYRIKS